MTRKFVSVCSLVMSIAVAMLLDLAGASDWTPFNYEGADGLNYYGVRDHDTFLKLGLTEKQAGRVARKLNKAMSKDTGFYDPGSGPCHDPKPGTQC